MAFTCTGFIEPLNLQCLMVNVFAGDYVIFIALAALFILSLAARFRMTGEAVGLMGLIFILIFAQQYEYLYLLALVLVTFIGYKIFGRIAQ